jgi:type III secretion protein L
VSIVRSSEGAGRSGRVVPAALFDEAAAARGRIAAAEREADAIRAAARSEAEALRREARAAGREEGVAEASAALVRAAAERDRLLSAAEADLVELAFAVAERVVGDAAERGTVVAVARRALEAARDRAHVAVRAHPADLAALRAAEPELSALLARAPGVALRGDAAIARGGVIVETEAGSVDATLATQLGALRRAVTGGGP